MDTAAGHAPHGALTARWWAAMIFVWCGAAMAGTMVSQSAQLIALRMEALGASGTVIGLNGATAAVAILCSIFFLPRLVPRLGGVAVSAIGLAIGALATWAFTASDWQPLWFVWRFALGLGIACFWTVNEVWVNTLVPERLRGRCVGAYSTSFSAGVMLGPAILTAVGTAGALPFIVQGSILGGWCLVTLLAGCLMPGREDEAAHGDGASGGGWHLPLLACPLAFLAAFVSGYVEGHIFNLLSLYGTRSGLAEPQALAMLTAFGTGAMLFQIPVGWLADRLPRSRLLLGAVLATLACLAMLPAVVQMPWLLFALLVVLGGAVLSFYTLGLTVMGTHFDAGNLPRANLLFILVYDVGMLLGPALGGGAMQLWNPHGMLVSMAVLLVLWPFTMPLLARRARRSAGTLPPA